MIGRRRPGPAPQIEPEQIKFVARPRTYGAGSLPRPQSRALNDAREFFGPDYELEIAAPWTAAKDGRGGYEAEITVSATPRSAK